MKAVMLAAGVGNRLFGDDGTQLPKSLLRFEGKTLLQRHLENLLDLGVEELELVCGFRMDEIVREAANWSPPGFIHPVQNKNYRKLTSSTVQRIYEVEGIYMSISTKKTRFLEPWIMQIQFSNCCVSARNGFHIQFYNLHPKQSAVLSCQNHFKCLSRKEKGACIW